MKSYIAKWALPKEKIPIHIEWDGNIIYDEIRIIIPNDFIFIDFLNVKDVKISDNLAIINGLIKSQFTNSIYFGILISSKRIYDKLKVSRKIDIKFYKENVIVKTLNLYARIFRPLIEVVDKPQRIELSDNNIKCELPIHLRYVGFGDVKLSIYAEIGGKIVSQGESFIEELFKRIWLSIYEEEIEDDKKHQTNNDDINIDEVVINRFIEEIEKKIDRLETVIEDPKFKDWISSIKNRKKFFEMLRSRTGIALFDLLSDLFDRRPTENVKLESSRTNIRKEIKTPIYFINICLKYNDILGNEYPLVKIPINVDDKRDLDINTTIEIHIFTEKWEEEPYVNVSDMKIDE